MLLELHSTSNLLGGSEADFIERDDLGESSASLTKT